MQQLSRRDSLEMIAGAPWYRIVGDSLRKIDLEKRARITPGITPLGSACGTEKCVSAISWVGDGLELS